MAFALTPATLVERSLREREAGRLMGRLGPRGYVVLSDGVVVGPPGVVLVTTLACSDRVRLHQGELWSGRFPLRHDLARARRTLEEVRAAAARFRLGIPVRWMACVLGSTVPEDPYLALDVELVAVPDLADRIERGQRVLDFEDVLRLAHVLDPARRRRPPWRPGGVTGLRAWRGMR